MIHSNDIMVKDLREEEIVSKSMHDKDCACLHPLRKGLIFRTIVNQKCNCAQGKDRRIVARAKGKLKRAKVTIVEHTGLSDGKGVDWTWDKDRECMVGRWSTVPFSQGEIGRL